MSGSDKRRNGLISARPFTMGTLVGTVAVTSVAAAVVWPLSSLVAKGIVLGGVAGGAGFGLLAYNARKLATLPKDRVPFDIYRWALVRMGMYALALAWAHTLDRSGHRALIGAAFGLLIARSVMVVVGLAAWRYRGVTGPAGKG
ncbi:MAG: hypothetical protein AMXMBFR4_29780 [Candidatus Hydrogenedentota bacterium]